MKSPNGFGARLLSYRTDRDWTQEHVAKLVGVSIATVSMIELGKTNPTPRTLKKFARALPGLVDIEQEVA